MHMSGLFKTCFSPKGPSSADPYIKIIKKTYWVMSSLDMR